MPPSRPTLTIVVALFLAAPMPALPRTWYILNDGTGEAPSIQAGIDSASAGDTVLVGPGTYLEHPNFSGKDLVLKSLAGSAQTILDGSQRSQPWVVGIVSGETQLAVLEGFTVTGGVVGVNVWNSQPTIQSNRIAENVGGGGIICDSDISLSDPPWHPIIRSNQIEDNVAQGSVALAFPVSANTPLKSRRMFLQGIGAN
jgi:hypothetical protein